MISFQFRMLIARIKYFFSHHIPWFVAYLIPRKVALYCFVRVYSVLGSYAEDYDNAYRIFESGNGR